MVFAPIEAATGSLVPNSVKDSLAHLVETDKTPFVVCYDVVSYFIRYLPVFSEVCLTGHACFRFVSPRCAYT